MVKAIDIHIHPPAQKPPETSPEQQAAMRKHYRITEEQAITNIDQLAELYDRLDMFGVLFDMATESVSGKFISNDYVADCARKHPKQFMAFGSVDPNLGKLAIMEAERCVKDLGMGGFKFHSGVQRFFANDRQFYPLWQKITDLGVPALFHVGQTGAGAGTPGGGGVRLIHMKPIPHFDDVAADFPNLTMILAHPAFPWQDEQLAMVNTKANVYMDISGWSPKYFSPLAVQYMRTLIQNKVLFGSDWPVITPERWLRDFDTIGVTDETVRRKIFFENSKRVLGLDLEYTGP